MGPERSTETGLPARTLLPSGRRPHQSAPVVPTSVLRLPEIPRMLPRFVRRGALLTALALAYASTPSVLRAQAATGTVRGHVTEGSGGRGIPEVQVTVTGTRIGALTNANGDFTLVAVPAGARTIEARRIGYQP